MNEIEKSITLVLLEAVEVVPNSAASKTIIRKNTETISVVAMDSGQTVAEKILPFDTFIQIIEGVGEVFIKEKLNILQMGQGIIIPAHTSHIIKAKDQFKMMSTIIKGGYENILL